MKELCIPVPAMSDGKQANVYVVIDNETIGYHFRIESFPWDCNDDLKKDIHDEIDKSLARITRLKKAITNYDKDWELIQIFNPSANAKSIQVLYRKRH